MVVELRHVSDSRGHLAFLEHPHEIPFVTRRVFWVSGVPKGAVRGNHAHRGCEQFLVVLQGAVTCDIFSGEVSKSIELRAGDGGLYIPTLTWARQKNFSADAMLLVLASETYDEEDYISDWKEYLELL